MTFAFLTHNDDFEKRLFKGQSYIWICQCFATLQDTCRSSWRRCRTHPLYDATPAGQQSLRIAAAATLEITASEPKCEDQGWQGLVQQANTRSVGAAAAALRPALLELASMRAPPRIEAQEVIDLKQLRAFKPLAEWLTMDLAQRLAAGCCLQPEH